MKLRLKQVFSLFVMFVFSLLPLWLFQYNLYQSRLTERERKIAQWERKAQSAQQFFNTMGRFDKQILHRMHLFKSMLDLLPENKKLSSSAFKELLYKRLECSDNPQKTDEPYKPTALFALETTNNRPRYFAGSGYTKKKSGVFRPILSALASETPIKAHLFKDLNNRVKGIFCGIVDFELLKEAPGSITAAPYNDMASLVYWNSFTLPSKQKITFICIFKDLHTEEKILMSAFNGFEEEYGDISFALVPVHNAADSLGLCFSGNTLPKSRALVEDCFKQMRIGAKKNKSRNLMCFAGEFANYKGLRFSRSYIDFNYSYELWVFNELDKIARLSDSGAEIIFKALFFAIWAVLFARALIIGIPLGISLKTRLTLIFSAVGFLPLFLCTQAALTQIDSASYRREEQTINDVLKHLEEADSSCESALNEFQNLCREADGSQKLAAAMLSSDTAMLETAVDDMYLRFKKLGFPISSLYVFPSGVASAAGFKTGIFQFKEGDNARLFADPANAAVIKKGSKRAVFRPAVLCDKNYESFDTGMFDTNKLWYEIAYFKKAPEACTCTEEPQMQFFQGKSARHIMRMYVAKRGSFTIADYTSTKQYMHHNFFLSEALPVNWYLLRLPVNEIFKQSLLHSVKRLEKLYPDASFGILSKENLLNERGFEFFYPAAKRIKPGMQAEIEHFMQVSESGIVSFNQNRLAVVWPCVKADKFFLYAILDVRDLRRLKMSQEIVLSILFIVMCIPVLWLSSFASRYLIAPLRQVESGLKKITAGDYKQLINLNRSDELGRLALAFDRMSRGLEERKNLGLFVSATLDKEIVSKEASDFSGLKQYVGAALVSDIRSFTTLSETYPVRDVVFMLNTHLKAMSECVKNYNGMVEQFVGDEIIAVFYASSESEAVKTAIEAAKSMMACHKSINQSRQSSGLFTYNIGIGIEPGVFLAGTINSQSQKTYFLFGEARGRAEELEADSKKASGSKIIVSEKGFKLAERFYGFAPVPGTNSYELNKVSEL